MVSALYGTEDIGSLTSKQETTMSSQFKRVTMAACVAFAVAAPGAYAAQGVNFDPNGAEAGGPGETPLVSFDWGPGHVLYTSCFGNGALGAGGSCVINAQGHLGSVIGLNQVETAVPANVHYTFVMSTPATVTDNTKGATYDGIFDAGDLDALTFTDKTAGVGTFFRIYRDQVNDVVDTTGAGYSTGAGSTLILEGTVIVNSYTLVSTGQTTENFDQFNGANNLGLITRVTGGTPSFGIGVTFIDTNYFKDPLTTFTLSIDPDIDHTDNSGSPFKNINPSTSIAGSPFSGAMIGADKVVDIYCGGATGDGPCTGQFQGDAISTFLVDAIVPEPGMLALMGIGLGGLGFAARPRQKKIGA
jgi:hypothetical protein